MSLPGTASMVRFLKQTGVATCLSAVIFAVSPLAHAGSRYAVLVGVSGYPEDRVRPQLPGATNDVALMRDVLVRKGFGLENMTILADRIEGGRLPTRGNILAAVDAVVEKAKPGDFVYLHFSGHGTQQPAVRLPADADPEPDGKSEVFLPIDVGHWDDSRATVENAIVDHELVSRLKRLLSKGAFVWSVIDACHSASLVRAGQDAGAVLRGVDGDRAFGIPRAAWESAFAKAAGTRVRASKGDSLGRIEGKRAGGGYVSFYAAQPWEKAPELLMPRHLPSSDERVRWHGVLTYTLASAIESLDGVSYRQLGDFVLQRYATSAYGERPTPVYSGSHLDAIVFGRDRSPGAMQWPIRIESGRILVGAGLLADLSVGARVVIVPTPASRDEDALATAEVIRSDAYQAELRIVATGRSQGPETGKPANHQFARLIRSGTFQPLRVFLATGGIDAADEAARVRAAVARMQDLPSVAGRLEWVPRAELADMRLHVEKACIWFVPPSGELDPSGECGGSRGSPSIPIAGDELSIARDLAGALGKIAQARAVLSAVTVAQYLSRGAPLKVDYLHTPVSGRAQTVSAGGRLRLRDGDVIDLRFRNTSNQPIDVTLIGVDARHGIDVLFPSDDKSRNRVGPGESFVASQRFDNRKGIVIHDDTRGVEHLLLLAEPANATFRKDYAFLAQEGVGIAADERGSAESEFSMFLRQALASANGAKNTRAHEAGIGQGIARVLSFEVVGGAESGGNSTALPGKTRVRTRIGRNQ